MGKGNTGHEVALYIARPGISDDSMKDSMGILGMKLLFI
jgi:hypothetical protein